MDTVAFDLVAGLHRLEACKRLSHQEIAADVVQFSKDDRQLWEIDENLCRAELTELERAEHLALRKEIYQRKFPQTKRGGDRKSDEYQSPAGGTLKSFHADTSEKTGIGKSTVQHAVRRAERINKKVRDRIRGNPDIADNTVNWTRWPRKPSFLRGPNILHDARSQTGPPRAGDQSD